MNSSIEHDSWGHIIEASDGYESLSKELMKFVQANAVDAHDRSIIGKLAVTLRLRAEACSCLGPTDGPRMSIEEIRTLPKVFESLFTDSSSDFPIELSTYSSSKAEMEARMESEKTNGMVKDLDMDGEVTESKPEIVEFSGTAISITVDKLGLKDAQDGYINSHFTITVAEAGTGEIVEGEPPVDTPFSTSRDPQYVNFGHTITLKSPLEKLEQIPGVAIFFEFKHYKTKGEYVSTKCYSFMELDELQDGPVLLEILKCEKPTDFARKAKPARLSKKELHLHLNVQLTHK